MSLSVLKSIVLWVPKKLVLINENVNKIISLPDKVEKSFTYFTKVSGATIGAGNLAKGSVDFAEAVACQDGMCATISAIGVVADGLQICTSFIPGPNVTAVVTLPVSVGCKIFVYCCKRSKLPWSSC